MDGTATINAKVDSLRLCGFVQNLACAKPRRRCKYWTRAGPVALLRLLKEFHSYCSTLHSREQRLYHRVTEATALMHVVDSLDELRLPRNLRELHLTRHRISRIDLPADTLASLQKARHAFCASRARATGNHARTRHSSTCGRTASRE